MGDIYDSVFRTILNDCRKLVIPVINEIFHEEYTGDEKIEFSPNEHFINQQDAADEKRITDTNFKVFGKTVKKYHLECESSYPDGRMTVRIFEYDAQIALDEGTVKEEILTVTFPNTAVLYLRSRNKTPDKMKYVIVTPGGTVEYDIPVMKVQKYSLDDIFDKKLLFLIPFYIFSHEKKFPEYNIDNEKLEELKAEYRNILEKLDSMEYGKTLESYDKRTIIELSDDVIREIAKKYKNVQEGLGDIMRGPLIKTEASIILNQGKSQGIEETKRETAIRILKMGKLTIEEISTVTGLSIEKVEQLKTQLADLQTV